jgi:uncharacterized protein YbjT (DUF2867 family)
MSDGSADLVLVTGGTGTLGREVVARLRRAGRRVRVLSRRAQGEAAGVEYVAGDLGTGEGIPAAVEGASVIIHCAGTGTSDERLTKRLVDAARSAGSPHLVFISVVGADRVPGDRGLSRLMFRYFAEKLAAERVVVVSGLPWTTLRATQFHNLIFRVAGMLAKLPIGLIPAGFRFQPVAVAEVGERLVELALGAPQGLVDEMGGPQVLTTRELFETYLVATGRRPRPVISIPIPGRGARAAREGANLCPEQATGRETWEEFLAAEGRPVEAPAPA